MSSKYLHAATKSSQHITGPFSTTTQRKIVQQCTTQARIHCPFHLLAQSKSLNCNIVSQLNQMLKQMIASSVLSRLRKMKYYSFCQTKASQLVCERTDNVMVRVSHYLLPQSNSRHCAGFSGIPKQIRKVSNYA